MTRGRIQTNDHQCALKILEEEVLNVIIDQNRLHRLLEDTVRLTHNYRIEQLEKLYSLYSNCIYSYRQEYDKTHLIEVGTSSSYKFNWIIVHVTQEYGNPTNPLIWFWIEVKKNIQTCRTSSCSTKFWHFSLWSVFYSLIIIVCQYWLTFVSAFDLPHFFFFHQEMERLLNLQLL